jgi:hypothetical protein
MYHYEGERLGAPLIQMFAVYFPSLAIGPNE